MRNITRIALFIFCCPCFAYAAGTYGITNATGCLENLDNNTVRIVKPENIYVFAGDNQHPDYSGVLVAPGQQNVSVPEGVDTGATPSQPAVLTGTNPHDAVAHIVTNGVRAGDHGPRLVVQMDWGSRTGSNACSPQYPCVAFLAIPLEEQCLTLLRQHHQI